MGLKPISQIKADLGIEPNGRVQKYFTATCAKHMDKYVPMKAGNLRKNITITAKTIKYNSPYAHYMYVGKVMGPNIPIKDKSGNIVRWFSPKGKPKHYTGKNIVYRQGGSYWDKKMVSAEMKDVVSEVQDYMRRAK